MAEKKNKGESTSKSATQQLVQISEIRDGVAVMTDMSLRATLIVSSLNFALKAEDEQNAIIYAFQDFLNSLDFQLQISVTSRKLDITPYIEELRAKKERQKNELLRLQMGEYINFVEDMVKGNDIMTKTFFATVPFSPLQSKKDSMPKKIGKAFSGLGPKKKKSMTDGEFEHYKKQLLQRVEQVAVGLRNIGLRLAPLQTQEMLELLYNTLNPVTSRHQRLRNVAQLAVEETEPENLFKKEPENKAGSPII